MQTAENIDQALFNHASMGIVVVNSKGLIITVNPFALRLFGYTPDELIHKPIEQLIPSRYHHKHVAHRDNYIQHPKSRPMGVGMDLFAVTKNGTELAVEVSLGNYESNGESYVIAFISDISVRKKAEAEIAKLNDELEATVEQRTRELTDAMHQLERSKEVLTNALNKEKELSDLKSRFVSMASHEFRTPLSTILSSASLVAKYTEGDQQENRNKHINRIKNSVNNLTDLLNEFLSIGKIEDGKIRAHYSHFNIKELLQNICTEMETLVKPGQQIHYRHSGDEAVNLDPSLLRNIILNLLSNAIKFSPDNGVIDISSTNNTKEIVVRVKDSGIGISAEDQEHLFERFFRGANATNISGTGLGLHIVAKYMELMNGQVSYSGELEKGSEFVIKFTASNDQVI
ncbi:PAS domain-containing sensor histidine kinase [Ferruginibacter sp.]